MPKMTTHLSTVMLLGTLTFFIGCGKPTERGPAYGQQQELRRQLAESVPVKEWGYAIADVRVSQDARKVLVVFTLPGGTNGTSEAILEHDGFRRYRGSITDAARRDAAMRAHTAANDAYSAAHYARITSSAPRTQPDLAGTPPSVAAPEAERPVFPFHAGSASILITLPDR